MRFGAVTELVSLSLSRDRRGAFSSIFGIVVGIASLAFFVALGLGVGRVVREKIFPVDSSLVEVIPSQINLGFLGGGSIDDTVVERLSALPGVERAYRKMNIRVPAVSIYDGDFFGRRLRMGLEIIAVGVDPEFITADVALGNFDDPGAGKPIPAIASTRLIEIYNKTFAPARSLPQLSGAMVTGFAFPVDFNRSFVTATPAGPVTSTTLQIAGVSERGVLAGVLIPLSVARRMNEAAKVDAKSYSAVTLKAKDPSSVNQVVAAVKAMGLRVDDADRRMSENAGAAVMLTTTALALLSLLICVLASFNIAHALSASVRARERELGIMRAVGASQRNIFTLVMSEALVLGSLGAIIGVGVALAAAAGINALAASVLPDFPFKPSSFFEWPWWVFAGGFGLGVLSAFIGSIGPSRRASRIDPARVLSGAA